MPENQLVAKFNPVLPAVVLTISIATMSGNPLNVSYIETENLDYGVARLCLFNYRRKDFDIQTINEFSFTEADSTATPLLLDQGSSPTLIYNTVVERRIIELSNVGNDWDGYGGFAPTPLVITNTKQFLQNLPTKYLLTIDEDSIYPNPNGTISIKWTSKFGKVVIEVGNKTAAFFSFVNNKYDQGENLSTKYLPENFITALNELIA